MGLAMLLAICSHVFASQNDNFYQEQPPATSAITFDGRGFIINGQRTFVASGSMHYPRIPQALWHDRLLRLKRSGLDCVQTYAFMNYHSSQPGTFDFSGEKDFNQYLQAAHAIGLYATVRAGMYVDAEWENGGYPEWLLLQPGVAIRTTNATFLSANDAWYGAILPIVATNQINRGGSVILVQLENEDPSCWGVDTGNQPYFTHLRTNALAQGIQVPMFFSGVHHSHAPAGTAPFDSVGRTTPWYSTEFWAGWFNLYGETSSFVTTYDRNTWQILAYGGNGYNYYMFHGASNFEHWNGNSVRASYDYGAALGQAGDLRPLYYHDKRAAWFARSLQAILENSTNASANFANAAGGVTAISARGSPAGTILFLDNNTSANAVAVLNNGAQMTLEASEIAPVVENFALTSWLTIQEADARIFGVQPQGNLTTLVLYGLPGDTVRVSFALTGGALTYADPAFATNAANPAGLVFSAPIADGTPAAYQLVSGTNDLRVLVMSKTGVDRTWFVDSAGTNYIVTGAAYVGDFTNANGQFICNLEEPAGNSLPTNLLVFDGNQFAAHALAITNQISTASWTPPALGNWQLRLETDPAAVAYDDSAWFVTNTPPLMGTDGDSSDYAWYRASLTVTNAGSYALNIPGINDWGALFINGQQVPMTSSSSPFSVLVNLLAGSNTVAVFAAHFGRDSLYQYVGASTNAFTPKGLLGPVTVSASASSSSLTNWYWFTTSSNSAPGAGAVAQITATNFDPVAAGWNSGAAWDANVFNGAGYAWFRTVLPSVSGVSYTLHFTNVDDNCTVYLNGANVVGTHTGWNQPFDVPLGAYWQTNGSNMLTVLVQNTGGVGGLMGTILLNVAGPAVASFPTWKLQGGVGTVDGTNVTWQAIAPANGQPVFYRTFFAYQPPAGVLPILRATWTGLSSGFIWLNGHNLGRYADVIPAGGIYLPECWLGAGATNELVIFDEQGNSPTSMSLTVETAASRQLLQCLALSVPTNVLAPLGLNATAGNRQISLAWLASSGATNYTIWRGTSSGNETFAAGTTVGTTFTDGGLTNGTTYYYVITAAGPAGVSGNSQEISAAPVAPPPVLPPATLSASPGNARVTLAWPAASGATNYYVWRGTNSGNETANIGVTANPAFIDLGLANGTTYYYVVTASGSGGLSGNSPEASATPFAPTNIQPPTSLTAYPGNGLVVLAWTASVGATNYTVWRGLSSGGEAVVAGSTANTVFSDAGLTDGVTYFYVVTAAGGSGASGNSSEASATPATATSGTWTANAGGNWSAVDNWFGGIVANGNGQTADFSTAAIGSNCVVNLDTATTVSTLVFGDLSSNFNWTLSGTNGLTLGTAAVINVLNQSATISTPLAGTAFTKTGAGVLVLNGPAANTFSGTLADTAGVLTEDFSNLSPATDLISNGVVLAMGGGILNLNGAAAGATSQSFARTILNPGENGFNVVNNGTSATLALNALTVVQGAMVNFSTTGSITTTTAGGDAFGVLGVRGNVNSPVGYATVGANDWASTDTTAGAAGSPPYPILPLSGVAGGYATGMGATGQNENLDLQANYTAGGNVGASTIRFNNPAATTVNVNGKWVVIGGVLVTPNMGANNCTVGNGNWFPYYSQTAAADEVIWQNNTAGFFSIGSLINNRGNAAAPVTYLQAGPGTVVMPGTSTVSGTAGNSANAYTGQSYLNGGFTVVKVDADLGAPATAAPVNLNGGTIVGNATFTLDNGAGQNPRPLNLLGNGGGLAATAGKTMTIDGVISSLPGGGPVTIGIPASSANNNTAGLVPGSGPGTANPALNATGTVVLSGANTYTGNTYVAGGTLLVTNAAGSATGLGTVTVMSGGTLTGNGMIGGSVTVQSGGALALGNPPGNLAVSNQLTLSAGSLTFLPVQASPPANATLSVGGNFTEGGTLIISNTTTAQFAAGNSFQLFSAASYSGAFANLVLPPLSGSLVWNTNSLKASGVLSVVELTPPIMGSIQISGGKLTIGGHGGAADWPCLLVCTTNLVAPTWTPVATNQFDAGGNCNISAAINPAFPQTYYRLQLQ